MIKLNPTPASAIPAPIPTAATPNATNATESAKRPGAINIAAAPAASRIVNPPAKANNPLPICSSDMDPNTCNGAASASNDPARINKVAAPTNPIGPTLDTIPTATSNIVKAPTSPPKATTILCHEI